MKRYCFSYVKLVVILYISLSSIFISLGNAEIYQKNYNDVPSDDPDQKEPAFISATSTEVGTPTKLRITVCRDWAYTFQPVSETDFPMNSKQTVRIFVDIVDENGNIANKKAREQSPFIMITLNIQESGSTANSYTLLPPILMLTDESASTMIYNKEVENLTITASAATFQNSDPVIINFKKAASIKGKITIPSGSAAQQLIAIATRLDDTTQVNTVFYIVQQGVTSYTFNIGALEAGTYKLDIYAIHDTNNHDLTKYVRPICSNAAPYNNIVLTTGQDKDMGTINLPFSGRGGVKGVISIQGRAAGDLSNTSCMVSIANPNQSYCNSYVDSLDILTNSGSTNDGNQYYLHNLQAGSYSVNVFVQNLNSKIYEWVKMVNVNVADGAWTIADITAEPFTGIYDLNLKYYETLLYKSPVDYQLIDQPNPQMVWENRLSKDANVPPDTNLDHTVYTIEVEDRCDNVVWKQLNIPHDVNNTDQTIDYGDVSKGYSEVAPVSLKQDIYNWSVKGLDDYANFAFTQTDNGWKYIGFNYGGGAPPVSSTDGGLRIKCTDNRNNFGFWQSPGNIVTYQRNYLYRARFMVSSTNASSRAVVPQFRCRENSQNLAQFDYLNIVSSGSGEACPLSDPQPYDLYFFPCQFDWSGFLAFDILNIDPNDQADGELMLTEVAVEKVPIAALKGKETVASYDFNSGDEGWVAAGNTVNTATGGALNMKATSNSGCFGYWVNPADRVPHTANKIYRGTFFVKSDSTKAQAPIVRFRYGAYDQQLQMVQGINSVGDGVQSPDSAGVNYYVYFYPPVYNPAPSGYFISVDNLNIDPNDKADATISLDNVVIETFDIPFAN